MHARIENGQVVDLIEDVAREQVPAPDPFPEGYEPTAEEQAAFDERQALHDGFVPGIVPMAERFHPDFVAGLVEVPAGLAVEQGWTYAGGSFAAPVPPEVVVVVPASVSRAQAKLALLDAGLLDDVDLAINGLTGDDFRRATIEWNERESFERQSPFLLQMAGLVGITDEQLDALFVDAASR